MQPTPEQQAADENTPPERLKELVEHSLEILKLVAGNPSTPPEVLQELASLANKKIRKLVASNPNTDIDVLLKVGAEFPEDLLNNPVFLLLILEKPDFLVHLPVSTYYSLLDYPGTPENIRNLIAINNKDNLF
jgi:hypothetical protein